MSQNERIELLEQTAEIVAAYVSGNHVPRDDLVKLIGEVFRTLKGVSVPPPMAQAAPEPVLVPAVPIRKSVTPDHIICLEDGKAFKSLKRHLKTSFNLTPEEYRAKWDLPDDYPMVASNYAARRSQLAKSIGLGRKADPDTV